MNFSSPEDRLKGGLPVFLCSRLYQENSTPIPLSYLPPFSSAERRNRVQISILKIAKSPSKYVYVYPFISTQYAYIHMYTYLYSLSNYYNTTLHDVEAPLVSVKVNQTFD